MNTPARRILSTAAALVSALFFLPSSAPFGAGTTVLAQGWLEPNPPVKHHRRAKHPKPGAHDDAKPVESAHGEKKAASPSAPSSEPPPRVAFTAAEDAAASIPGMPDARFWADSPA